MCEDVTVIACSPFGLRCLQWSDLGSLDIGIHRDAGLLPSRVYCPRRVYCPDLTDGFMACNLVRHPTDVSADGLK